MTIRSSWNLIPSGLPRQSRRLTSLSLQPEQSLELQPPREPQQLRQLRPGRRARHQRQHLRLERQVQPEQRALRVQQEWLAALVPK